jgi:hypothetical protein
MEYTCGRLRCVVGRGSSGGVGERGGTLVVEKKGGVGLVLVCGEGGSVGVGEQRGYVLTTGGEGEEGSESERRNNARNDTAVFKNPSMDSKYICLILLASRSKLSGKFFNVQKSLVLRWILESRRWRTRCTRWSRKRSP